MKPEEKKFILENKERLSTQQLAQRLNLKERKVKKLLEREKDKVSVTVQKRTAEEPKKRGVHPVFVLLAVLSIVGLVFLSYSNTFQSPMLWDDINLVKNNPDVKSWNTVAKALRENLGYGVVQQKSSSYRPLQSLTYIIDHTIWKENAFGFHLTNTILHALVALGVFWLIQTLFKDFFLSATTALVYAVHPIHTEAVTYISGRADPLSTVFLLSAYACYVQYAQRPRWWLLPFMSLSFIAALGSRENTIILPVLALLYHYVFRKPIRWTSFATLIGLGLLYIILRATETIGAIGESQTLGTSIMQRLPGTFVAMTNYMRIMFLPLDLHMEYGRPVFQWADPKALIGIVVVAAIVTAAIKMRGKNALISFGLLWYLVNIIPVSNIVPVNAYMAEHWLYIPSIGIIVIVAYGAKKLFDVPPLRNAVLIFVIGIVALFSYLTFQQNKTWQNPIAFYEGLLKYAPNSARLYSDLSTAYFSEQRYDAAISVLKKAIQLKPDYAFAHNNLGAIYNAKDEFDKAIPHLKKAIEFNMDYDVANFNLGNAYKETNQIDLAIEHYERTLKINPRYFDAYDALGIIYSNQGNLDKAVENYKKAIDLNPDGPRAYNNLASAYLRFGKQNEAMAYYEKALKLSPSHPGILHNLGNIYDQLGQKEKARQFFEEAVKLNSPHADTYIKLAAIYQAMGKEQEAQALLQKANEIKSK
ncbi:MAG TPA: tetratricopeptide repeat protein [Candidatus Omnitrophota bacterium]|nr:tetratricopeptide repeat protein [Candidatus Omnitrophota bacterium]